MAAMVQSAIGSACTAEPIADWTIAAIARSEEHTSELQSRSDLVCRLLLEKKTDLDLTAAPRRRFRLPPALGLRDFRRFWAGETISLFGDQISLIALPLVGVLVLNASEAPMGLLGAAELAPNLLFSLHAGALVDRRGRRRQTMIFTAFGRAVLLATIPVAYWLGVLTLAQLYVVGFLVGTVSVLFFVSYQTLFVALVPRERYLEANSLLNGSRALSFVGGPSVGGLLVQILSAPAALVADAVSFLASALAMKSIDPAEPPTE